MDLLNQIRSAGIVGCGGAGFPTHVKLNGQAEYLLVNGAECEPLLRTDHWLMRHRAAEIVRAVGQVGELIGASRLLIVLKETYEEEIDCLCAAIQAQGSRAELFLTRNFYPAGDEQIMVCEATGRTVPPLGIPLEVGVVVSNVGTMDRIADAMEGKPFTHKEVTVTGQVERPVIVRAPLGTPLSACIEAAGGKQGDEPLRLLVGGPLMGTVYPLEKADELYVTKTTGGVILIREDSGLVHLRERSAKAVLRQAKTACIQCSYCTQLCPRYLIGHPLHPHRIMRKVAYAEDPVRLLQDPEIRHAQMCCECGVCETYACPMGLAPRQVNHLIKQALAKEGIRCPKPEGPFTSREEREWRRASSRRIAARLGVADRYDIRIDEMAELHPARVTLALRQSIGAPAVPVVEAGMSVSCGQVVAEAPEKGLGVRLHASMDGVVSQVSETEITIEREAE